MRHTEKTLRTKDVTEDILTLIFAKDYFKSGRMKEELQKISSGVAYTTSAVILGHYVEFLSNYATYLGKKLEDLGRGLGVCLTLLRHCVEGELSKVLSDVTLTSLL